MTETEDTVLIVDDDEAVLSALSEILQLDNHLVLIASSAEGGLRLLERHPVALVIADNVMPDMTGVEFLNRVRERWPDTTRMMLTGCADLDSAMDAINRGHVFRFVTKPWDVHGFRLVVKEGLDQYRVIQDNRRMQLQIRRQNETLQLAVDQRTEEIQRKNAEMERLYRQLKAGFLGTVEAMATIVEVRDPYTAGHQKRVSQLACAMAKRMGLPENEIDGIQMAAAIHDLGKIAVPAEILTKPGPISGLEFGLIKTHPEVAYEILKPIQLPWPIAHMVAQHHERENGSGYPKGLRGDRILPGAKIIAVADVVEAMASHRPYRPAVPYQTTIEELQGNRGILYDPKAVDACLDVLTRDGFEFEVQAPVGPDRPNWQLRG